MTDDWNDEEIKRGAKEADDRKNGRQPRDTLYRFRLPYGDTASVTIVSPRPVFVWEHQFTFNNNRYTFEPSLRGTLREGEVDILTKHFGDAYRVWFFLVIDHSTYQGKKAVYKDRVKLLPVKSSDIEWFKEQANDPERGNGDMTGMVYRATRSNAEKSSAIGEKWDFRKRVSREQLVAALPDAMEMVDELLADGPINGRTEWAAKLKMMIQVPKSIAQLKTKYFSGGSGDTGVSGGHYNTEPAGAPSNVPSFADEDTYGPPPVSDEERPERDSSGTKDDIPF